MFDPLIGAFYTYPTPIPNEAATFSADIRINGEVGFSSLSLNMGLIDLRDEVDGGDRYRTYLKFFYSGDVTVFVKGGPSGIQEVSTPVNWEAGTWYNVKIETIGAAVKFFWNNTLIYEGELLSNGPIDQVRFVHDNYAGEAYIDNFRTNDEPLSIKDVEIDSDLNHFYNLDSQTLNLSSQNKNLDHVLIFNGLGQQVINKKLSQNAEIIDMKDLSNGVYIIKVTVDTNTKTFKVIKL